MKILLVNTHHKLNGGAEKYYFELGKIFKSHRHQVAYFSMLEKGNFKSPWSKYFVSNVDPNKRGVKEFFIKIPRIFYSFESRRKISNLLDDFKPDIVHLNNIYYHITSSILTEIVKRNIPVVQTVHDYQIISPNVILYHNGNICEISKGNKYFNAVLHKCVDNSYIGSIIMATILFVQNLGNKYFHNINLLITPSKFMKSKLVEYGINSKKIIHINNFIASPNSIIKSSKIGKYILFIGRLTEAKGVRLIIELAQKLPFINFKLAGNFDNQEDKAYIYKIINKKNIKNIEIVGFVNNRKVTNLILNSKFVIVPSKWYENQPYSILESYILGKPVVASKIGGIKEIVIPGKTGLLFKTGNIKDFSKKVRQLWEDDKLLLYMMHKSKIYAAKNFNADIHYKKIMIVYNSLI